MIISGRWVLNAIYVRNTKRCSKSVATSQPEQPSSNDDFCLFLRDIFFNEMNRSQPRQNLKDFFTSPCVAS